MVGVSKLSGEAAGPACASLGPQQNRFLELGEYELKYLVWHLLELSDRRSVAIVLDIDYLEIKAERDSTFDLIEELAAVTRSHPEPDGCLEAISLALQQNGGYIVRRPTTLFQCVWNTCCWKDSGLLGPFLVNFATDANAKSSSIIALLTRWRLRRAERSPGSVWVRSLRPSRADLDRDVRLVLTLAEYEDIPAIAQFSPDSAIVVIWFCKYQNGQIVSGVPRAWDCDSGRLVMVPSNMHLGPPQKGRSPDGRFVATYGGPDGGWDFPVRVSGFGAPSDVREYHTEPDTHISAVAISPTNRLLAGTGYGLEGGDAYVWDLASGLVVARPGSYDMSHAVSFSADETKLAFASGSELKLRDLASGDERAVGKHDDWIRAIAFSPDGLKVASLSHDGTCRIHSIGSTSSSLPKPIGPTSYIAELAFSPSGNRLVSRADNGTLHLWDGAAGVPVACLVTSDMIVLEGGDASPSLFVTDETVRSVASLAGVWDARTGRKLEDGGKSSFYPGRVLNWSPDGSRLCSYERNSERHEIQLFDPRKGLLASFSHNARIRCVAFAPDSQHVAYGAADGWLRVRVASTGKLLCEFRAHEAAIAQCAVSGDGTRLATIGADQQLVIWSWTELLRTDGPTGDQPRKIRPEARLDVVKVTSEENLEDLAGESLRIAFAAFDDRQIVVQTGRSFNIWDLQTLAHVTTITSTNFLEEVVDGRLTHLRTSGDEVVISDAVDGRPKAWFPVPVGLSGLKLVRSPTLDVWAGMISHSILHFCLERD